jgi:hypothetical protein
MDWKDRVDFEELVRRFDRGDRGADLLAQLNRAAYDCFHAPWETLPAPRPRGSQEDLHVDQVNFLAPETPTTEFNSFHLPQGRLPIEEGGDQDVPSTHAQNPSRGFENPSDDQEDGPESEAHQDHGQKPLALLASTLEALGHRGYLADEAKLLLELPYDSKTDSLSWMTFLLDLGKRQILVMSQSDMALQRVSEADLERYCRIYNRRNTCMNAGLFRPQEGARPRLRWTTTLTFAQVMPPPVLYENLTRLLKNNRQYWNYLRRCLPV